MDQKTIIAESRDQFKKGPSRRLRKNGRIPAIIYGHSGTSPISIDEHEFRTAFKRVSENTIIQIKVDKKSVDVLVKDFQSDIVTGRITHIDFYEIEKGKELRTNIPVYLLGTAEGVKEGGILEQLMHEIEVACLPQNIPEKIEIEISSLDIGSSIHISDIEVPEGVRFLASPEQVVTLVTALREEKVEEVEEEELEGEGEIEGEEGEAVAEEDAEEEE